MASSADTRLTLSGNCRLTCKLNCKLCTKCQGVQLLRSRRLLSARSCRRCSDKIQTPSCPDSSPESSDDIHAHLQTGSDHVCIIIMHSSYLMQGLVKTRLGASSKLQVNDHLSSNLNYCAPYPPDASSNCCQLLLLSCVSLRQSSTHLQ